MMNPSSTVQNGPVQSGYSFQPGVVGGNPLAKDVNRSRDTDALLASGDTHCKRPRLSSQPIAQINGSIECPPSSTVSAPLRSVFDEFRANFNDKLKGLLTLKLCTYFSHLETVEQEMASIRTQHKDIICRIGGIESASKQLTKLINDKSTSLPVPSTSVGQRRTLSSQAPRLPPPPPMPPATEAPSKRPPTDGSDSKRVPTSVNGITSPPQTPIATVAPQQKRQVAAAPPTGNPNLPISEVCNSAQSTVNPVGPPVQAKPYHQVPGRSAAVSAPVAATQSPMQQAVHYSKPPQPRTSSGGSMLLPLSIPTETIDLTESEPNVVETTSRVDLGTSLPTSNNNPARFSTPVVGDFLQRPGQPWTTTLLASFGSPIAQPIPSRQPPQRQLQQQQQMRQQQQQQRVSKHALATSNHRLPLPPPSTTQSRSMHNISNSKATSKLLSLSVAPLPPTPMPPIVFSIPTQPMPQLTIAEAVEGICLQWSISGQAVSYESAVTYEIFSYASSDVPLTSICSSVPWKKIGDVAALPLPMACTLTHIQPNNIYYFIIRSVDRFDRYSPWSNVVHAFVS